jgi:hypothetical protein
MRFAARPASYWKTEMDGTPARPRGTFRRGVRLLLGALVVPLVALLALGLLGKIKGTGGPEPQGMPRLASTGGPPARPIPRGADRSGPQARAPATIAEPAGAPGRVGSAEISPAGDSGARATVLPEPAPVGLLEVLSGVNESDLCDPSGPGFFDARRGTGRRNAVSRYGGNEASEAAVELGLRWLAAHQSDDGRWSTSQFSRSCPRGNPCGAVHSTTGYDAGVTGLTLLAFVGAGYTHHEGPYRETIDRAIRWLKSHQDPRGFFFDSSAAKPSGGMYGHGVCTFALGEACAMAGDDGIRETLVRAVKATESSQQSGGGWSYSTDPRDRAGEFTLSVWQMMGLLAARKAGVVVEESSVARAKTFVRTSTDLSGGVFYTHGSNITSGATGAGVFARCMLGLTGGGWIEKGLDWLDREPEFQPTFENELAWEHLYGWYYRTLAGFQLQGRFWRDWNQALRPFLISTQRTVGHASGSWSRGDYPNAGILYSTAMCVLMLETYYRYPAVATGQVGPVDAPGSVGVPLTAEEERRRRAARPDPPEEPQERLDRERAEARARLRSAKPEERYLGARKLSEMEDRDSVVEMIEAAEKERGPLRAAHLLFIGRLRAEKAIPFLVRQLDDGDERAGSAAASALQRTTGLAISSVAGWKSWFEERQRRDGAPK